jgi:hypothetical protein
MVTDPGRTSSAELTPPRPLTAPGWLLKADGAAIPSVNPERSWTTDGRWTVTSGSLSRSAGVTEFTVTEDQLKLLRHAYVTSWDPGEGYYGAVGINSKRPYGKSVHVEAMVALQIVLATGEFRPGRYRRTATSSIDWHLDESS